MRILPNPCAIKKQRKTIEKKLKLNFDNGNGWRSVCAHYRMGAHINRYNAHTWEVILSVFTNFHLLFTAGCFGV